MQLEEKPKLVQVAMPAISSLAATFMLRVLTDTKSDLLNTYYTSSYVLCCVALVTKLVLGLGSRPKVESISQRIFNYTVTSFATYLPSRVLANYFLGKGDQAPLLCGVFYGLAQVCVTTLLGATKEKGIIPLTLPCCTALLSLFMLAVGESIPPRGAKPTETSFQIGVIFALCGTVIARLFETHSQQRAASEGDVMPQDQQDHMPGFSSSLALQVMQDSR